MKHKFSAMWSDALGKAIAQQCKEPYQMDLAGQDAVACRNAVNQGIDSHLEACFCPELGDSFRVDGSRLSGTLSPQSLPVLVRRLLEAGDEGGLASSICETLDIELI